jgi:O-antigen/teichoic acid export membrane protein
MSGWPTNIFSTIIRSVALPALARDLDDPDQRALRFAKALRMIALISFPVCLLMAALAQPLVSTLYGTRWKEAAPALVWLAVYGAIRVGMEPFQDFVVAGGRTRVIMAIQLVWLVCLLGALLVGVDNWGIAGAGASQALVASLIVLPVYATVLRQGGVTYRMVVGALGPPFLASSLAAVAAWAASEAAVQPWQQLLFGAAAGVGVYSVVAGRGLVSMARFLRDQRASRRFNPPVVAESYETAL